jgi:hypothetical protein
MDRYKAKIGLKSAYDDQKKALEKLKKNDKIDDENTRRLNASILSKAINDSNDTVNGLEGRFTDFANVIYKEQEDRKMKKETRINPRLLFILHLSLLLRQVSEYLRSHPR